MDNNNYYSSRSTSYYTTCKNDLENPGNLICKEEKRTINEKGEEELEIREYKKPINTRDKEESFNKDPLSRFFGGRSLLSEFNSESFGSHPLSNQFDEDFNEMDTAFSFFLPFLGRYFSNGNIGRKNDIQNEVIEERRDEGNHTLDYLRNKKEGNMGTDAFYMNRRFNDNDIYDL